PVLVEELATEGLLVDSDGAKCVFPPGHSNRDGAPLPLIVQNSAGGFTYAATDLAGVRDRTQRLGAQLLVYVVGLPQSEHLEMVFAVSRQMGWLGAGCEAVHVGFGNVLGADGKMFRTRQGTTVKLDELLDEAVARARSVVESRASADQPSDADLGAIASAVGLGAVKYADLSTDRTRDYRFDWDRMLSLDGNTAPYIQYAHARCGSILRRAHAEGVPGLRASPGGLPEWAARASRPPVEPEERQLAIKLLCFGDAVASALEAYAPHRLCTYLFELASAFTTFYERCNVLRAPGDELRLARLGLCALTGAVLRQGLDLLGIEAPERM
ncbi:MAG TPA: arginine--tRNA ligase, partial [Acidimicrobiales bacterium]|nr:arginine--tRNA ligase [Acidimicrobiales bacterium]